MGAALASVDEVCAFVYREARLLDTSGYVEWEALWTDDAVYWVPAGSGDIDPERSMSIIYDNRSRIALRVRQLLTGRRHAQNPPSKLVHLISNVEVVNELDGDIEVAASAMVYESHQSGETLWASRNAYTLRPSDDGLRMARKTVVLANAAKPLGNMAFLI